MDKDDTTIDLSKLNEDDSSVSSVDVPDVVPPEEDGSLKEVGADVPDEEFKIHHLNMDHVEPISAHDEMKLQAVPDDSDVSQGPASKVKVKFDKFITLVATHTYEDILKKNADEDVIISTNLLTDLANAHEDGEASSKKLPMLFAGGFVVGILITWLLLKA
ncbi:hypothetical protein HOG17_04925 [Candidatus Peregrinibacteria bacterium]|jgi:hypothetical protein|nr:hypothetical protein [Candidatus Peregrinibacteria bacterium]MBT4148519.1 hypothetical protein [Candidatus Peregrinibacteria bacterium]MBT4366700.1 hypothetical protein [Candidatus Peregrinibacteria bacterium]MBT4455531.1 hypothetical protein [Candidatus Peregrinibacteria bacterium]